VRAQAINSDLTGETDLMTARRLRENKGIAFMGDTKGGAFDISADAAAAMLSAPLNANGRPNSDVVRLWINGLDVTRRPRDMFIIDFGTRSMEESADYAVPFAYVLKHVKPLRLTSKRISYRDRWWVHMEPRPDMLATIAPLRRFIVTPAIAKHRVFTWIEHPCVPDHQLFVFARGDDYFFGVLHSRVHELWALRRGTSLEDRPRYTPTTTFDTFPFPWSPGQEPHGDPRVIAIGEAARSLASKRDAWLNPPGGSAKDLSTRTLTALYNQRPSWLASLHAALDVAVLSAYGWPTNIEDAELLERLLALNHERAK
jgi:hypothetical protein